MQGAIVDSLLAARRGRRTQRRAIADDPRMCLVETVAGRLRVLDTGGERPPLMLTPDGPCVIEHYAGLIDDLAAHFRVICFDMPGFGFSFPRLGFGFGMDETADALVALMDQLQVRQAVLAFSCANGFYALNLAARYPQRVTHLILAQTPSLEAMMRWTRRIVPKPITLPFIGQTVMAATAGKFAASWFELALPRGSSDKPAFVVPSTRAVANGGCFCLASLVQGLRSGETADVSGAVCPSLVLYGDADFSHKYTDFESIRTLLPQARLQAFAGCGHFPDLERRNDYVAALTDFVAA